MSNALRFSYGQQTCKCVAPNKPFREGEGGGEGGWDNIYLTRMYGNPMAELLIFIAACATAVGFFLRDDWRSGTRGSWCSELPSSIMFLRL